MSTRALYNSVWIHVLGFCERHNLVGESEFVGEDLTSPCYLLRFLNDAGKEVSIYLSLKNYKSVIDVCKYVFGRLNEEYGLNQFKPRLVIQPNGKIEALPGNENFFTPVDNSTTPI